MSTISVSLPSDGDTIDVADYNTPINTIVNEINGNLDNANIAAAAAIAGTKLADASIPASKMDTASNPVTRADETIFDHVASGGVWSGDAYGSTRVASMTALVAYIDGYRGTISAVTARSFTASRDTYVDILNTAGTFTLVYTEVTNNAASPALAANSIRVGIIVTGASNIANVGSVNQGEENKVLPIASSNAYSVTDSLGNLICPRDPQRRLLGYRQITADFGSAALADVTGLNIVPFLADGLSKIKVHFYATAILSSSAAGSGQNLQIQEGATVLQAGEYVNAGTNYTQHVELTYRTTPTAGTHTYKLSLNPGAGTLTVKALATKPAFMAIERG